MLDRCSCKVSLEIARQRIRQESKEQEPRVDTSIGPYSMDRLLKHDLLNLTFPNRAAPRLSPFTVRFVCNLTRRKIQLLTKFTDISVVDNVRLIMNPNLTNQRRMFRLGVVQSGFCGTAPMRRPSATRVLCRTPICVDKQVNHFTHALTSGL